MSTNDTVPSIPPSQPPSSVNSTTNNSDGCQFLTNKLECLQGLYCPNLNTSNPDSAPAKCLPTPECEVQRLLGKQCANVNGSFGAQGRYEPVLCAKGYVCRTPSTIEPCPEGYFCPSGTFEPKKCDWLAYCPEGSLNQKSVTGIVIAGVLDLFLLIICIMQWRLDRLRLRRSHVSPLKVVSRQFAKFSQRSLPLDLKEQLLSSFRRAMNGKDLRMNFTVDKLGYTLPNGKEILHGVSGQIHAARMTAIIGPSGAGKTTFMNVLCGKVNRTSGKLLISGRQVELSTYKKIYGFVPQDDIMHNELTVRENVLHSARMRSPSNWSPRMIESHVDNILATLNLSHVAYSIIGDVTTGGISGGQRKRVNIAMELAATPLCLCLDEPTSGLDSTAALEVTDVLSKITELGMTVIAVIHQPRVEIFRKFDDVLMIVPGGRTAFFGPTSEAKPYFESLGFEFDAGANEADTLMDILSGRGKNPNGDYRIEDLVYKWDNRTFRTYEIPETPDETEDEIEESDVTNTTTETFGIDFSGLDNIGSTVSSKGGQKKSEVSRIVKEHSIHSRSQDQQKQDKIFHSLAGRLVRNRGAGFFKQIYYACSLSLLQQYRTISGLILEVFVGTISGVLMGLAVNDIDELYVGILKAPYSTVSPAPLYFLVAQFTMLVGMAVALAAAPAGTKVFSEEIPVYWRKVSSGHSPLAYYLGKSLAAIPRIILAGTHFSGVLFYMTAPVIPYWVEFSMIVLTFFGVYGLCAFVSMIVKRENATLLAVVFALFSGVFCGYGPTLTEARKWNLYWIWVGSYNMYATEAHFSETLAVYDHIWDNSFIVEQFGFTLNRVSYDFLMMLLIGLAWRVLAFFGLVCLNREKQR